MREGASGKRRYGYAWMTLADLAGALHSFGVTAPVLRWRIAPVLVGGRPRTGRTPDKSMQRGG